jgi:hypothetical protein
LDFTTKIWYAFLSCQVSYYELTAWNRFLLEKLTDHQLVEKYPHFMEPKVHYRILNSTPPLPVLIQINLVHAPQAPLEDRFNIILSPSSKWPPSFKSPQESSVCTPSLSHSHLTLHPYVILLDTVALENLFKCMDCEDPPNDVFFPVFF